MEIDVLIYEVGFGVMTGWEGEHPPHFDLAADLLERKIANICGMVGTTSPPVIFLTGKGNFRDKIATLLPYKGNRNTPKPYHYDNLRAYMVGVLGAIVVDGMEADDALAIEQMSHPLSRNLVDATTIICSRDKDLRQVPGWYYAWEVGNQPSFGPEYCDDYGWLSLSEKGKLTGMGDKFFLAQCLMGDRTDNIGGIPKCGPVKAFKILDDTKTYEEGLSLVLEAYKDFYGDDGEKNLLENGQLLYMVRELDIEGNPILWKL